MKEVPLATKAELASPEEIQTHRPKHHAWSLKDARVLYDLDKWGSPYYHINEKGHVAVTPALDAPTSIDLFEIVEEIKNRGIQLPVLIRFQDLLRRRVIELNESFRTAIEEFGYGNAYRGVYPIKVNQLHE